MAPQEHDSLHTFNGAFDTLFSLFDYILLISGITHWHSFFFLDFVLEQAGWPASEIKYSKKAVSDNKHHKHSQHRSCTEQYTKSGMP